MGARSQLPDFVPTAFNANRQSLFMSGLDILNRPNAAIMGFGAAAVVGGDAIQAGIDGLFGRKQTGGADLIAAITGTDRNSPFNRRVGLAADVLNPFDPFNYIGIGGLTRAGKAAKLAARFSDEAVTAGKTVFRIPLNAKFEKTKARLLRENPAAVVVADQLAETIGEQAKKGQRGLLTIRNPITGDVSPIIKGGRILGGIGTIGGRVADTGLGRGINKLFGGKKGEFLADSTVSEEAKKALVEADRLTQIRTGKVKGQMEGVNERITSLLSRNESVQMTDIISQAERDPQLAKTLFEEFVDGAGSVAGQKRRRDALLAREDGIKILNAADEDLGGVVREGGFGPFFQSRKFVPKAGTLDDDAARLLNQPLRPEIEFTGVEKNRFNPALVPRAAQPVSRTGLTEAGLADFDSFHLPGSLAKVSPDTQGALSGTEWFQTLTGAQEKSWLAGGNRKTLEELADSLKDRGHVVREQAPILEDMTKQMTDALDVDGLLLSLQDQKVALRWDDAIHNDGNWTKVSQGRWANTPLAVPKGIDLAMERFEQVMRPGPDKPWFGEFLNTFMPEQFKDPGLLAWWRGLAITGGGLNAPAFMARNLGTGLFHNALEGLGMNSARGIAQTRRLYQEAALIMDSPIKLLNPNISAKKFKAFEFSKMSKTGTGAVGDVTFSLRNGKTVKMSKDRFVQEYFARGVGGNGSRDIEKLNEVMNASTKRRNQAFGGFFNANERLEFLMRAPLTMKYIEDTLEVASMMGRKMPSRIDDMLPGSIGDVAWVNGRDAAIRAHFDYADLSEFERGIRNNIIPFYTWSRKAFPFQAVKMMQEFGQYTKFARGYWNAFKQQGITPEDLPDWAAKSFAIPISPSKEGMVQWIDFTGFLPFMDLLEAGEALGTAVGALPGVTGFQPPLGSTPTSELLRFFAVRGNPAITLPAELGLRSQFFTRRRFGADTPDDVLGLTTTTEVATTVNALFPPVRKFEQINPGGILGEQTVGRNQPSGGFRALRALTGVNVRKAEKTTSDRSRNQAKRLLSGLRRKRRNARNKGNDGEVRFFEGRIRELEKQLGR